MKWRSTALLLALSVLAAGCKSGYSGFSDNPSTGGGDGGNNKPTNPISATYEIYGKVELSASIEGLDTSVLAKNSLISQQETPFVSLAQDPEQRARFSEVQDCRQRLVGDIILKHHANDEIDRLINSLADLKNADQKPLYQLNRDVLNGTKRKDSWIFSRVRIKEAAQKYLRYCDQRSKSPFFQAKEGEVRHFHEEKEARAAFASFQDIDRSERQAFRKLMRTVKRLNTSYAVPNYLRTADPIGDDFPDDTEYSAQKWHYDAIATSAAWTRYQSDPSKFSEIAVAVIDTGVDYRHEDLAKNILVNAQGQGVGYDFISDEEIEGVEVFTSQADPLFGKDVGGGIDSNPFDNGDLDSHRSGGSFHGTHVAGTIAAATNNQLGVAGVALNAKIIPVRVLGVGGGTDYDIAQGILWAAGLPTHDPHVPSIEKMTGGKRQRADIINMSLGGSASSPMIQEAVKQAFKTGVMIVAAAGNSRSASPSYPASYPEVIGVGAVAPSSTAVKYTKASYSNIGPNVDIVAPGGCGSGEGSACRILSTWVMYQTDPAIPPLERYVSDYGSMAGTSMAAPHVSGALAMLKGYRPTLSVGQLRTLLISTASTDSLYDYNITDYGFGLIDLEEAFKQIDQAAGHTASVTVTLSPEGQKTPLKSVTIDASDSYTYSFEQVPAGRYILQAGIDTNGDGKIEIYSKSKTIRVPPSEGGDNTTLTF